MKIIGILGGKFSGKDTIAEYLIKHHGFQRYAFADPIKRGAMEMFGFTEAQMWGTKEDKETVDERWNISPRKMLQLMGTELFQYDIHKYLDKGEFNVGRAVWVQKFKLWFEEEEKKGNQDLKVVISDVRFQHEAAPIKNLGGEIWRVERPSVSEVDAHASETEYKLIEPDKIFINDGTLDELYLKVENYLKSVEVNA